MGDHVFICYARQDQDFVLKLAANLKERGARVWLDQWDISPSDDWDLTIDNALYDCAQFLIVLSPAAVASREVRGELRTALNENKPIVPVLYQTCRIPRRLQLIHYADFTSCGSDDGAALGEVLRALGVRVTPPEPVPPTVMKRRLPFEPEMVRIPAGEFLMGSREKDVDALREKYGGEQRWWNAQTPQRKVHLPDYEISKYPVTNLEYQAFVQDTGHKPPKHWEGDQYPEELSDHPVVNVTWHDAVAYCEWLSKKTGKPYRLPTEAGWEKAARGTDGRQFPWGDEWNQSKCNTAEGGPGTTTSVGQYSPEGDSPYGVADMAGNVWEWCADWLQAYEGNRFPDEDYGEEYKVWRGGSWRDNQGGARCVYRNWHVPWLWEYYLGFRCARGSP